MMEIEILKKWTFEELEGKLRQVPLMGFAPDGSKIMIYRDANISIKRLYADEVNPPTFYLLRENLELQRELRKYLLKHHKVDIFNLDGALEIKNEKGEVWTLTPPIVEVVHRTIRYVPREGEKDHSSSVIGVNIPLLADGAHRTAVARELRLPFNAIYISGVNEEYPTYYAHPNGWNKVEVVEDVPKTMEGKKLYRLDKPYDVYRDFGIIGCGKPRYVGK